MKASRPGITLVEVLVAIFIMAIGLLAILVLFPLGALNMARALKDDRCATLAANADSMASARLMRSDSAITNAMLTTPAGPYLSSDDNGPSYPVFVDPYFVQNGLLSTIGTATANSIAISRVTPSYILNDINNGVVRPIDRWFSLLDDLTFDSNGVPTVSLANPNTAALQTTGLVTGPLNRQGYYTFAYLLRRLMTQQANTTQLTVIVYSNRAVQAPVAELTFALANAGNVGDTSITLTWAAGQQSPDLRRGNWLLDNSYENNPLKTSAVTGKTVGYAHAQCYKVMDAIINSGTTMTVNIYPPLQDSQVTSMVVLDSATEVFDRGTGR